MKPKWNASIKLNIIEIEPSISKSYQKYADVFSTEKSNKIPNKIRITHGIDLEPDTKTLYDPIYHVSTTELRVLREYLTENEIKR